MELFPYKEGFNAQYQTRLVTAVGERYAIARMSWNDGVYGEQQVQFFGTDGAPTSKIVIDSFDNRQSQLYVTSYETPSTVVGLTGQITSSMVRSGRIGSTYTSELYFRRGNDQGFGPKLIPALGDSDDSIGHGRFPIQISFNRRHELAALRLTERVDGIFGAEKVYISSNSLP